jgi:hypothetical protein
MELTPIKANCTELNLSNYIVLFSYKTPVAYFDKKIGEYYKTSTKWSRTTSKHITQWLAGKYANEPKEVPQDVLDSLVK